MKNLQRVAESLQTTEGIMTHSVPRTSLMLVAQKKENSWLLTLMNPEKTHYYQLGICSDKYVMELWKALITLEVKHRISAIERAKELKKTMRKFLKLKGDEYYKLIKI